MWARNLELALGLWLAVSPFVFRHGDDTVLWTNDLFCSAALVTLSLSCYWHSLRHAHLLELLVAGWLVGFGWFSAAEVSTPASQNHVLVGLLVAMFAIVPSRASVPPEPWRKARYPDPGSS